MESSTRKSARSRESVATAGRDDGDTGDGGVLDGGGGEAGWDGFVNVEVAIDRG